MLPPPKESAPTTDALADFLSARIAEDEVVAEAAREHEYLSAARDASALRWVRDSLGYGAIFANSGRVLAECDVKRRIVEDLIHLSDMPPGPLLAHARFVARSLAAIYADHPDYREEWKS